MAIGKDPPQFNSETKPFARWKLEVETWVEVTEHAKEKRCMVLALSLPEKDLGDIRTKGFELKVRGFLIFHRNILCLRSSRMPDCQKQKFALFKLISIMMRNLSCWKVQKQD